MSKWVQFSFNCFWTPCVEKKTTEWQLLIQNANLWHGTVKMACHSQKAGVCYASHFSSARHMSLHSATSCICFWNLSAGDSKHDSTERLAEEGLAPRAFWETISLRKNQRKTGRVYLFWTSWLIHVLWPRTRVAGFRSSCMSGIWRLIGLERSGEDCVWQERT